MESYIQISKINDFIFCPRSVYLHSIYDTYKKHTFQRTPQIAGSFAHQRIDKGTYSSRKRYLIGLEVYCEELELCGKIDVYDRDTHTLIERKRTVQNIYDGYRYQLYAQMACLQEMGYVVEALKIHSLTDNKRYEIEMPNTDQWATFLALLETIKTYDVAQAPILTGSKKCEHCIYQPLCHNL